MAPGAVPAGFRRIALHVLAAICAVACAGPQRPFDGFVATPDGRLYVRASGAGPELILLHGLGDSSVTWRKIEPGLREAGFRVVVVDSLARMIREVRRENGRSARRARKRDGLHE